MSDDFLKECPICKKKYHPAPMHAWKITTNDGYRLVCSYHCMRQWECTHNKKRKYARKGKVYE